MNLYYDPGTGTICDQDDDSQVMADLIQCPAEEIDALGHQMAAAPEMYATLRELISDKKAALYNLHPHARGIIESAVAAAKGET